MMELLEWFQQLNAHELSPADLKSESSIFFAYVVLGLFIRKPVLPLAFLLCYILVNAKALQSLEEYHVYLTVLVIYSYVFNECPDDKSKLACVTICLLSFLFAIDAFLYGVNGYHGEYQTLIWQNIEYLATCAHIVFISTLLPIERIWNCIRGFIASISSNARNSAYLLRYWYNG